MTRDLFADRHIGPSESDQRAMLATLGYDSLDAFIAAVVPADIRLRGPLKLPAAKSEQEALAELRALADQNQVFRSYLGMGYHDTYTPGVILRNVLENPGWYTAYTPYQAEIAQGRLEALLNFQTMVSDLTGLEIANASLLDEGTAAAEAMHLTEAVSSHQGERVYLVDAGCHPQTIAVVQTRADARGVKIVVGDPATFTFGGGVIGALLQYPATDGAIRDYRALCKAAHDATLRQDLLEDLRLGLPEDVTQIGDDEVITKVGLIGAVSKKRVLHVQAREWRDQIDIEDLLPDPSPQPFDEREDVLFVAERHLEV